MSPAGTAEIDKTIMHSFTSCLMHCVFATKERRPLITPPLQQRLWPYLGGIARENGMKALEVGGVADHIHILLSLPATLALSKAVQLLKGNPRNGFMKHFQSIGTSVGRKGYGAFSIGVSGVEDTVAYIRGQEAHHRKRSFREEVEVFLKKHGIEYDQTMLD